MIVDRLENASQYHQLGKGIEAALRWLGSCDLREKETGREDIDGENLYAMIQRYKPRRVDDAKWEAHRKYVDVQYVVGGAERMGYAHIDSLKVVEAYDPQTDVVLLTGNGDFLTATEGTFLILGPQDAHMPAIELPPGRGDAVEVSKIVLKVAVG